MKARLVVTLAVLGLLVAGPSPAAESLAVEALRLERAGKAWRADVEWRVPWDREPFNQVHQGVPIGFTVELELFRERGWWFDASLGRASVRREVYFNRLTRQYRVIDWASGQRLFTREWSRAREQAERAGGVALPEAEDLAPEAEYYVGARVVARREQLSLPARVVAAFTSLWEGASEWRYRPLPR